MKYKYILPTLAAMGMLVASCSNDEFLSKVQGGSGQLVTVSASAAGGETRMAVTETASGDVKFTWENNDKLYVINPSNAEITPFALTEGAGKSRGTFSGTPTQAYTSGQSLMALFTHNTAAPATINQERNGVYIDLSGQDGTLTDKYQYMFGQGIYQSDGNVEFSLSNLVSVVKATVNNLPQDETFSQIIFSDNNSSYRSNAYLMLQDGRHGDSEYHAGDLVRKGTVYSYNGQWNEPVELEEEYESAITLNGSFSAAEGSLTKYFYVMETGSTIIYNNQNGSGVNDSFIGGHYMIQPFVLLMGTQHVYSATASYPKGMGQGKIFDLQMDAQVVPSLTPNTPTAVVRYDDNGREVMYAFKAESAGSYTVNCSGASIIIGNSWHRENYDFELNAGEWAFFKFSDNTTATVKCPVPLELDKQYTVQDGDCYTFTPTETGLYKLQGIDWGFKIQLGEENINSNPFTLVEGNTYKFNFQQDASVTLKKLVETLSVGDNTCATSNPGPDSSPEETYYLFTPSTTGLYQFKLPNGYNMGFVGTYLQQSTSYQPEYTKIAACLNANTTYIVVFHGMESSINVNIETATYVSITPNVSVNIAADQNVMITNNTGVSNFYKVEGSAVLQGLYGENCFGLRSGDSKLYGCQSAGTLTISVVDKTPVKEYTVSDQIVLEAGKVYVLNVSDGEAGDYSVTYSDETVHSVLGMSEDGYNRDLYTTSWLNPEKIYLLSSKTVTLTLTKN